ncbi:MAG: prephenate dehydrogenase [Candidatus Deianiraeaceae bacterium]|jgi:prephenate dehydrogenase
MRALVLSCGLIGGSVAKSLVNAGWEVHATTRKLLTFEGIKFYTENKDIPQIDYDIICICSPRGKKYEIYHEMFALAESLSTFGTYIVDVSSVQNQNNLFQLKYHNFVPCHPIAGSETTGFENSSPEILKGKKCLVIKNNPPQEVLDFWQECGMIVDNTITSCMEHDRIFAKVSHLPQLLSFNFPKEEKPEYKEFYRLKYSSRAIWDEIFLHNRAWILEILQNMYGSIHCVSLTTGNEDVSNEGGFERLISQSLNRIINDNDRMYAGTGLKTILSAGNKLPEETFYMSDGYRIVNLSHEMLLNLD